MSYGACGTSSLLTRLPLTAGGPRQVTPPVEDIQDARRTQAQRSADLPNRFRWQDSADMGM